MHDRGYGDMGAHFRGDGRGMLRLCTVPGCMTLTLGGTCVAHDVPEVRAFPRGRPLDFTVPLVATTAQRELSSAAAPSVGAAV
jgi:hypothetical protein